VPTENLTEVSKPYVILKLDDLWYEDGLVHPGWIKVIDFLNEQNIKGTIGIVGNSLETDNQVYFDWIKKRHTEGHEIWHHGFCHCRHKEGEIEIREYRGKGLEEQCASIAKTQTLAQEKLGITLQSFGAPYNSTDEFTTTALARISEIKIWMFKETKAPTDKFLLNRIKEVNIEYPVHQPDFEQFKAGYEMNKSEDVLVIQGHPRSWTEEESRFEKFKQIIFFLKKEKVQFITPYEYYLMRSDS
jgi:peptidoglycan/xylan/chitin deacetylase (PgdA/CDA1 family)